MTPRGGGTTAAAAPPSRSDQDAAALDAGGPGPGLCPEWQRARCARIVRMTAGSWSVAIRRSRPPQWPQASTSTPNARCIRPPSSRRADCSSPLRRPDLWRAAPRRPCARACVGFQEYGTRRVQKHGTPESRSPYVTRWGGDPGRGRRPWDGCRAGPRVMQLLSPLVSGGRAGAAGPTRLSQRDGAVGPYLRIPLGDGLCGVTVGAEIIRGRPGPAAQGPAGWA